ncbi:Cell division protein FtsA [Azospirillaceae bacterium]
MGMMTYNGGKKTRKALRGGVIAALDIGSTKVCCFIARVDDAGGVQVIGVGHQSSLGVKAGAIINMEGAETAISNAVHAAEQMAGETIRSVVVNVSGGQPTAQSVFVEAPVMEREVTELDLRRAINQSRIQYINEESELIHAIPTGFVLDGNRGIRDPRGMFGEKLGVQVMLISAGAGAVRNIKTCVSRCHIDIESHVVSAYASGLACLVEDETQLGVTCIDMGGGVTTISVFFDGNLIYIDSVPVGGAHVTNDIARGLTTPVVHAERMKTLYGSAIAGTSDEREVIDVPQIGEEDRGRSNPVPKSLLVGIIQPRLEEIFELVRCRLEESGMAKLAGRRVVLTGGASQLPNTRELAQLVLDKQVRLGRPTKIRGLVELTGGPAFSTVAGLLLHAARHPIEAPIAAPEMIHSGNLWGRVGMWLRDYL